MSNIKNYAEQGGEKWVVNGILEITADGQITINGTPLSRAAVQADSIATTVTELVTDFNSLLAKLKAAGVMTAD